MSLTPALRRVFAILETNGLGPAQVEEQVELRFASALLRIQTFSLGAQEVIALRAPVLRDVSGVPESQILAQLNRRNCESHFGKWVYYRETGVVALEYDLLGDELQENELLTAVAAIARLADEGDDSLQATLGTGRRAVD
jgi:hypothetical protein